MSKKYIALIIALLLLAAFLMIGCIPKATFVNFDPQGGTVSPDRKAVFPNEYYGELPVPTKPDYTFIGWYTEKVGGTEVTSSTIVPTRDNHTLYAHYFTPKKVTVTFDPNYPGATVSPDSKVVTVGFSYGALPKPNHPYSVGLIFLGWFTEKEGGNKVTEFTKVTIDHDQTLYAHWK